MKYRGILVSLAVGLTVGAVGMAYAADAQDILDITDTQSTSSDTPFAKSDLPGGGIKVPHNDRLHLSTDQRWMHTEGHLSDLIRLQWTKERAKPAISWADEKGDDKTAIVSHAKANDPAQADHNHISIETTMSPSGKYPNQLFTRFEIPFDQDIAEIRTHSSNFNVVDGILRVAGSDGVNRDLQFARTAKGNAVTPRWTIRADTADETGSGNGSNLQIIRYSDEGKALDTPFSIDRSNGNVGIGNTDPSAKLDVGGDRIRIRESMTPESSSSPGKAGELAWDSGYLYICVAENKWKRVSLESW